MALTTCSVTTSYIAALADLPNDDDGLTAAQLKAKFDQAPTDIKNWINNILLAELGQTTDGDSGADNVGATAISGLTGATVQALLEALKNKIDSVNPVAGFALVESFPIIVPEVNDGPRIQRATDSLTNGGSVFFADKEYISTQSHPLAKGITWEGVGCEGDGTGTLLKINAGANPAITNLSGAAQIKNMYIRDNGGTGPGIRVTRKLFMHNVIVSHFKEPNLLLEQDATNNGPYESIIEDCRFLYSQSHGAVIGNGANSVTFINSQFKWNGFVNSDILGASNDKDGLYIGTTYNPNSVTAAAPQSPRIIGGDASYNSRYGWNFDTMDCGHLVPGYGEGNDVSATAYQVRIGNIQNTFAFIQKLEGDAAGVYLNATFAAYYPTNTIFYGGMILGGGGSAKNSYLLNNSPNAFLALSTAGTLYAYLSPVTVSGDFTGEYKLVTGGAAYYAFYNGSTKLVSFDTTPEIHASYYKHGGLTIGAAAAAPVSGTWARGTRIYNTAPSAAGYMGWICVTAGTPGTWKGFGLIEA